MATSENNPSQTSQTESGIAADNGIPADLKADLKADAAGLLEDISPETNRRLRLRADALVLPLLTMASVIALLDKNALGFAAIFGIKDDAHLVGQQYSWLGSVVYFGYMVAQLPLGWILVKVPLGKLLGGIVVAWGVLVCSIMACNSFASLAAIRFLLGFFEAGVVPINMMLMSLWYRRDEQPLRTAIWYNTLAGVLGGIFAFAISRLNSSYPIWKLIFLVYGSVSLALGLAILLVLPDHPSRAWFYNAHDRKSMVVRIMANQTGHDTTGSFKWSQVREAVCDPRYFVLAIYAIAWGIVNAGITNVSAHVPYMGCIHTGALYSY